MTRDRLLLLPLAALVVASVVLIIAGILAWGAASDVSYDDWIPTFAGVFVGAFILAGGLYCARHLQESTCQPYRVRSPQILLGTAACAILIGFALLSAASVGNRERYRARLDGEPTIVNKYEDPTLEPRGFVAAIILICFPGPVSWLIYGIKRFYVDSIDPISSEVQGLDPMGEIMKTS